MIEAVELPTTGLMGVINLLGTENPNDDPALEFDQRRSRCYELAGYALTLGDAPASAQLIHGSWHGPEAPARIGHAWLEARLGGIDLAWEPITAAWYPLADFLRATRAWEERRYSQTTARQLMLASGHYGRWHESRYP